MPVFKNLTKKILLICTCFLCLSLCFLFFTNKPLLAQENYDIAFDDGVLEHMLADLDAIDQLKELLDRNPQAALTEIETQVSIINQSNQYYNLSHGTVEPQLEEPLAKAKAGSQKILDGYALYKNGVDSSDSKDIAQGKVMMYAGFDDYNTVTQLFTKSILNYLLPLFFYLGGTLLGVIGMILTLIFKSRKQLEDPEEDKVRKSSFNKAIGGFGLITASFGVTLITYLFLEGDYYIFYGLALGGIYQIYKAIRGYRFEMGEIKKTRPGEAAPPSSSAELLPITTSQPRLPPPLQPPINQ